MATRDVSIIVVSWNTVELLRGCLCSIYEQTSGISFEVIVVDNASSDGSAEMVRNEFPDAVLIANLDNRGFAAANNQALRIARGEYLLLLNPDTLVLDGAIQKSLAYMQSRADIGVMGCQVWESEHCIQRTCFGFPTPLNLFLTYSMLSRLFPRSRFLGRPELRWWDRKSEHDVDVVSGMFMLVRRKAMDQVGHMDEAYFIYAEEADWCYRFHRARWRCAFAPVGRIMHLDGGGKSSKQVRARMHVQLQKSIVLFNARNIGWGAALRAKVVFLIAAAASVALSPLLLITKGALASRNRYRLGVASIKYHILGVFPTT